MNRKDAILSYNFFLGTAFLTLKLGALSVVRACFSTVNLPDLGALKTGDANAWDEAFSDSPLEDLEQVELAQRLRKSLTALKKPMGDILSDFFLHGLRYEEIARSRGVAVGSVGVYLKRGLEAMRRIWVLEENS